MGGVLKLLKIAITGPISSGKSTVCELFANRGAYVLSADEIAHEILKQDTFIQNQINQLLGQKINFHTDDYRKQIAELVFKNVDLLKKYEALVHPKILELITKKFKAIENDNHYIGFVCEVPLLYETNWGSYFDKIIVIDSSEQECIQRFLNKTQLSEQDWKNRMNRFLQNHMKLKKASYVIKNSGSISYLSQQVEQFINTFLKN